jgi:hypothetical protein
MSFHKKSTTPPQVSGSETPQDDFYVQPGVCTLCGAPQATAPDLIDHSTEAYGSCYFKRQPQTAGEIERAVNAIAVSCISGLRYRGTNEEILKRLYEIGEGGQCDHQPTGNYKKLIWETTTFESTGSIGELSELIITQIILGEAHLDKRIINFKIEYDNYFEFIYRWANGATGNTFRCHSIGDNQFFIEIGIEENGDKTSIRSTSMALNAILRSDKRISKILWFDKDHNRYDETALR